MDDLKERQIQILEFLETYLDEHGRPPTIEEICDEIGYASTNGADYQLGQLEEKGYIERTSHISRGIELTDKATDELQEAA